MTINGHVENGRIVLDESVQLVDGMKVRIEFVEPAAPLPDESAKRDEEEEVPTLYERMKPLVGMIKDGPSDFARNHDHYIHGTPKE